MHRTAWLWVCLALAACGGDGDTTPTETLVHFDLDPRLAGRASALHVEIFGHDGSTVYDETRDSDDMPALRFPATIPLVAASDGRTSFRVVGTLLSTADVAVTMDSASSEHTPGELRELWLCLDASCESVLCEPSERCAQGTCVPGDMETLPAGSEAPLTCGTECAKDADCPCDSDTCTDNKCLPVRPAKVTEGALTIAAGARHTCVVAEDGAVLCWGANNRGQIGADSLDAKLDAPTSAPLVAMAGIDLATSVELGDEHSCATTTKGEIYCWGNHENSRYTLPDAGADQRKPLLLTDFNLDDPQWTALAVGSRGTCGISSAGIVRCCGDNTRGQLGIDSEFSPMFPEGVDGIWHAFSEGDDHGCGINDNHRLLCWGNWKDGRLAQGDADPPVIKDQISPLLVPGEMKFATLFVGGAHACAIAVDGVLSCWGKNGQGQLGLGTDAPETVETVSTVGERQDWVSVTAGGAHTCAIAGSTAEDRELFCWGVNSSGELGVGDTDPRAVPTLVGLPHPAVVAAGSEHACAITQEGTVWCWGNNDTSQLGLGPDAPTLARSPARVCLPKSP